MASFVRLACVLLASFALTACGGGGGGGGSATVSTYTVGGTISGLSGTVVLQNNSGDQLSFSSNGTFTFSTALAAGTPYNISVLTQPAGQLCVVGNGTGTIAGANITSVTLNCTNTGGPTLYSIGGTVSGLNGSLVLNNNGGDALTLLANGTFAFSNPLASTYAYVVTVATQPAGQTCTVTNGGGSVPAVNVTSVSVSCVTHTFSIGGNVSGLSGSLVLSKNGGSHLTVSANGAYAFSAPVSWGSAYNVAVATQPSGQTCTVSNNGGSVTAAVTNINVACTTNTYTVGGVISGLSGSVTLKNNGTDAITRIGNGSFSFPTPIAHGAAYSVNVSAQPAGQTCTVSNGGGSVPAANVTSVSVSCVTHTFKIGGNVSGLNGSLVLSNNGGSNLAVSANGAYAFGAPVSWGSAYNVAVATQPAGQTCTVSNNGGNVTAAVTNINVTCTSNTYTVGGVISGLSGSVTLKNNGTDAITRIGNGSFSFPTPIAHGAAYSVNVTAQSAGQNCGVSNSAGTIAGANVTNVIVNCTTNTYSLGFTVTGLGGTLVLSNNGGSNVLVAADGSYTFTSPVAYGSAYSVAVATQPAGQICTVSNGNGTVPAANVSNVLVSCAASRYSVGFSVSGLTPHSVFDRQLSLRLNGGSSVTVFADGNYTFGSWLTSGAPYDVAVGTQPTGQTCTVSSGTGTVTANVTNVAVICTNISYYSLGFTVTGLGGTLVLQNGDDRVSVTTDGSYTFTNPVAYGSAYSVIIATDPSGQRCTLSNRSGTMPAANVGNVLINCILAPPVVTLTASPKTLSFSWPATSAASYYRLLKNPDGASGYTQIGNNLTTASATDTIPVHLHDWANASYIVEACNADGCVSSSAVFTTGVIGVIGRFGGASGTLSADGKTLAVSYSGNINVYYLNGNSWQPQTYFKPANSETTDNFGSAISLSADGNTLAVGASGEDSSATGINGNQTDNSALDSGAVYIFTRSGNTWSQQAYVKTSSTNAHGMFGRAVSLSADGNVLAAASGSPNIRGSASVFIRSGSVWSQQSSILASNADQTDNFGSAISLSADGNTLAVGASQESSNATGINGNQADNSVIWSGAAYVFTRSGSVWSQQAYIKASNTNAYDYFGGAISLSAAGNIMAVGAKGEDGNSASQTDNSATDTGAVYVFIRSGSVWSQKTYVKAANVSAQYFGSAISLSSDGNTLAAGGTGSVYLY